MNPLCKRYAPWLLMSLANVAVGQTPTGESQATLSPEEDLWLQDLLGDSELYSDYDYEESVAEESEQGALTDLPADNWIGDATVFGSYGWKENLLLSPGTAVDSPVAEAEVELFAMNPKMGESFDLTALFYGQFREYSEVDTLDNEHLAVLYGQLGKRFDDALRLSFSFEGVHSKQALDASVDDFEVIGTTVEVWSPKLSSGLEVDLGKWGKLAATASGSQSRFEEELEDYDTFSGEVSWDVETSAVHRFELTVLRYAEDYALRPSREYGRLWSDAPALEIAGSEYEASWFWLFGEAGAFRLKTSASWLDEDDAEGDYYEKESWELKEALRWRSGRWKADLSLSYRDTRYANRPADEVFGREDDGYRLGLKVERDIGERSRLFFRYERLDKNSNSEQFAYESSTVQLGISFTQEASW